MSELAIVTAKLAGIRHAVSAVLGENIAHNRGGTPQTRVNFDPNLVAHYFSQTAAHLAKLKALLPELFEDFQPISVVPSQEMAGRGASGVFFFSRGQLERLVRDIDQIFEIRANSALEQPKREAPWRVFISHGRSDEWRLVQPFIERDVGLSTIELEQEPSLGRTIIEKLFHYADHCDSAVIIMTGDDIGSDDVPKVRENVMHEIGFFQGRYGRGMVVLLHEEGVSIPTNLAGVVYIPFPKGKIDAGFHVLQRELNATYRR